MSEPNYRLADTLTEIWQIIFEGIADTKSSARRVALASVEADVPQQRMVALRLAHRPNATVDVHTDMLSHKIRQFRANPNASILIWHPERLVQVRLGGQITIARNEQTAGLWPDMPQAVRENYGHHPAPGEPIAESSAWENHPDPSRFGVLTLRVGHIDYVSLDPAGHRRAAFSRADGWAGQWLSP